MMIPMQGIDKLLRPRAFRNHMKDIAMHQVFKKSPEQHAQQKNKRDADYREVVAGPPIV